MKKIVLIANRLNVFQCFKKLTDVEIVKLYVLKDSLLDKLITTIDIDERVAVDVFTMKDKARLIDELELLDFDVLISNGCPFIFPISKMKKDGQLFINIHPTLLPDLKGKTPLSGVFMTHRNYIGSTMHYIDDGIDTGRIISQKKVKLTSDIDQGLVYKISFDLEEDVFYEGWKILEKNNFHFLGTDQQGEGSYFNRTDNDQTIDINKDDTDLIIDKIKSFNLRGQGTLLSISQDTYRVYFAEKIINSYLLEKYNKVPQAEIAFKYDNKMVIKTIDGMIKLIDYEKVK